MIQPGLLLSAWLSLLPAQPAPLPGNLALVEGRFGKALDAGTTPVEVEGSDRYRRPPLTVECWAKLKSKGDFNVLVACDDKASAEHWEVYTFAGTGFFSAYLPGLDPPATVSTTNVCDGRWHYLAMTFDGSRVRLFVDGKAVREQAVRKKAGKKPVPGPLTIGLALEGKRRIGCDGAVDDVRISSKLRDIQAVPAGPLPLDQETVGQWRFDRADAADVDPAWTPRPREGNVAPWEKETDKDWVDGRLQHMDTGPFFGATFTYPVPGGKPVTVFKGTAVRLGEKGEAAVLFDRNGLRLAAGWTGGYLTHSSRRFGLLNTPAPAGTVRFTSSPLPGWADPAGGRSTPPATAPLPRAWGRYRGLYLHGKRVVFSYTVGPAEVLDAPWVETAGDVTAFTRTLEVGPCDKPLSLYLCDLPGKVDNAEREKGLMRTSRQGDAVTAVAATGPDSSRLALDGGRAVLTVGPRREAVRVKVYLWQGGARDLPALTALVKAAAAPADVRAWTRPGPARWTAPIVTRGQRGPDDGPYAIDTLTVPHDNPHKALMFLAGVDLLPDGRVAVCTAHGDVWLIKGADDKLERLTWKRFATGLYQPLGLKVVGGKVHVLERGQLTRLADDNGDGEADRYECVSGDWHQGGGEHSFDTCLETDPAGNFYFFKTGDTHLPTGGCLMRLSKDGERAEVFATGFRHPIGLGVSPDGLVTGADQEGNWMPATRVDVYKKGGFYGDMRAHHRTTAPTIYDGPLCWLPRQIDNSAGGQVWAPTKGFGPLSGGLLHLSYGRCRMMLLMPQQVEDVMQAGAVDLGLSFLSGVCRGRFGPDGHLYLAGLRGWQTGAVQDGCLQRVRYTGRPARLPVGLKVMGNRIEVRFSDKLDRSAEDVRRWRVDQWNYHWSADYGSKRWSVARSDREGQDTLPVRSAALSQGGMTVVLKLDKIKPVMQMQIAYTLETASKAPLTGVIYNTIHRVAPGR